MRYLIAIACFALFFIYSTIDAKQNTLTQKIDSDSVPVKKQLVKASKNSLLDAFPDEVTTDTGRVSFLKRFNKGKILYAETCAKCHDSLRNGKKFYPDFSLPQLMDYEMRFQYPEHNEDLKETNITIAEMDDIVDFLRYKKKNLAKQ